jgi:hypothetical protein
MNMVTIPIHFNTFPLKNRSRSISDSTSCPEYSQQQLSTRNPQPLYKAKWGFPLSIAKSESKKESFFRILFIQEVPLPEYLSSRDFPSHSSLYAILYCPESSLHTPCLQNPFSYLFASTRSRKAFCRRLPIPSLTTFYYCTTLKPFCHYEKNWVQKNFAAPFLHAACRKKEFKLPKLRFVL